MEFARGTESPRDAAVVLLVDWCGWLAAVAFAVGCVHGWWWGGDLQNLPFVGDRAAWAAEHRGWPWIALVVMGLGGLTVRRLWRVVVSWAFITRGAGRVGRRAPRFRPSRGSC